ncbi:MAG: tetratricopeptide repeat protein [Spirochaetales bacterium]|nr:MAG: tetratricopeptide repeat protein [Spirochaetales bacterium]
MKRTVIFLFIIVVLGASCAVGAWLLRDYLVWPPGDDSFPLSFPRSAFAMPDGGYVVAEDGGRIIRTTAEGDVLWVAGRDSLYGSITAVDVADDGTVYVLDRLDVEVPTGGEPGTWQRFERLIRIGIDGEPAGVLTQKRFSDTGGFVRGSLRAYGDSLWYLFAADDGLVSLAKVGLKDGRERVVIKTDWSMGAASVAPGGPEGAVAIATAGAIVRYVRGRFELLSELKDDLAFPTDVRYLPDGSLLAVDAYRGNIALVATDGTVSRLIDRSALSGISRDGRGPILETVSVRGNRISFVEQASSVVVSWDRMARTLRTAPIPELDDGTVRKGMMAWAMAAGTALAVIIVIMTLIASMIRRGPIMLAGLAGAVPGLLAAAIFVGWIAHDDAVSVTAERNLAGRARLEAIAERSVGGIDAALVERVRTPADFGGEPWIALRSKLADLARSAADSGVSTAYVTLYSRSDGILRFVCDNVGVYRPGLPQRYGLEEYASAFGNGQAVSGTIQDPNGFWLAGAAAVKDASGIAIAYLEVSGPATVTPLAVVPSWNGARMALGAGALALVAACGWIGLTLRRRFRIHDRKAAEARAAAEAAACEEKKEERPAEGNVPAEGNRTAETASPAEVEFAARDRIKESSAGSAVPRGSRVNIKDAHRYAIIALKRGDCEQAAKVLERILVARPADTRALNNLAVAYLRLGRSAEAIRCLERAVVLDPQNAGARANLAKLWNKT